MKKVLVLAAAAALFAAPALATIVDTKHDMTSGTQTVVTESVGTSTQVCVYCHTPHGAVMPAAGEPNPLWNRANLATYAGSIYAGWELSAAAAGVTAASINATDARLCFSCHAGDNMTTALNNGPNDGTASTATTMSATALNINDGTDGLGDDHPIGFSYDTAQAVAGNELLANPASIYFNGATNVMWCSSCHDVHEAGVAASVQFMRVTTANSQLCTTCHVK